jgi:hypothetical protein
VLCRAYFTSLSLIAGGGATLHGIYRRPTAFWVNNADLYLPIAIIALVCVAASTYYARSINSLRQIVTLASDTAQFKQ